MRFQQARRFRQLQRLLGTLQMRQAVTTLRTRLRYVLVLFFVTYLAGFVVVQVRRPAADARPFLTHRSLLYAAARPPRRLIV